MDNSTIPSTNLMTVFNYESHDKAGVIVAIVVGSFSLAAILFLLLVKPPRPRTYSGTHLFGYVSSLLLANALLAASTMMSFKWVMHKEVWEGGYCTAQGALRQTGGIATALWSFIISLHLFNLLFLRSSGRKLVYWATIIVGWGIVVLIVVVGPTVIQRKSDKGPYFGIAGPWCWISDQYPQEQIYLEYLLEFISVGLSFILYTAVLLRVRGNLRVSDGKWSLHFTSSWRLAICRDLIDSVMLKFAQSMVWFPIAYTIILLPIAIVRLKSFSGEPVSYTALVFADAVFNLIGLINVLLLVFTRRLYPDIMEQPLPDFSTQRSTSTSSRNRNAQNGSYDSDSNSNNDTLRTLPDMVDIAALTESGGVSPYMLTRSATAESYHEQRRKTLMSLSRASSAGSTASSSSGSSHRTARKSLPPPVPKLDRSDDGHGSMLSRQTSTGSTASSSSYVTTNSSVDSRTELLSPRERAAAAARGSSSVKEVVHATSVDTRAEVISPKGGGSSSPRPRSPKGKGKAKEVYDGPESSNSDTAVLSPRERPGGESSSPRPRSPKGKGKAKEVYEEPDSNYEPEVVSPRERPRGGSSSPRPRSPKGKAREE